MNQAVRALLIGSALSLSAQTPPAQTPPAPANLNQPSPAPTLLAQTPPAPTPPAASPRVQTPPASTAPANLNQPHPAPTLLAQTPPAPTPPAAPPRVQTPSAPPAPANLNQLMRGTLYPAANIVFYAQDEDPAKAPRAKDPNMATDPLTSVFGKWEAVENASLAIAEQASLLNVPGRLCSNGVEAPVKNADWIKFVAELRQVGLTSYAAAKAKDQDKMIDISDLLTKACANCHLKYREKRAADRCK